ncbi:MAG: hypothetical protein ACXVHX_02250 [Solirubrobacteraceae bacterium]
MREYLGEEPLRVIVGPSTAAYLVPAQDQIEFERAVALASSRWGGAVEPILAVNSAGELTTSARGLLDRLDVAGLVDVGCGKDVAAGIAIDCQLPWSTPDGLTHVSDPLWTQTWRVGLRPTGGEAASQPDAPLWEKVAAGVTDIPCVGAAPTEDWAGRAAISGLTILDTGLAELGECAGPAPVNGPLLIWITEPNSLEDAWDFWNTRVLRPLSRAQAPMVLLPRNAFDDWIDIDNALRDLVRRSRNGTSPDVVFISSTTPETTLAKIATNLGFVPHAGTTMHMTRGLPRMVEPGGPVTYMTNINPDTWLGRPRTVGIEETFRVQVFREDTALPTFPSDLSTIAERGAYVRFRFTGGFIDQLPRRPNIAKAVHSTARWTGALLETRCMTGPALTLPINAPSRQDVLDLITGEAPADLALSDKGRLARGLLDAQDASILSDRITLEAITALTTKRPGGWRKTAEELLALTDDQDAAAHLLEQLAGLGGRLNRSYRSARTLSVTGEAKEKVAVLERLSSAGWAERGAEVRCSRCPVSYFVPLGLLGGRVTCPGCNAGAALTTTNAGVEVFYRLDAFADHCCDQGVVAHVAVDQVLTRDEPFSALHLGLDLNGPTGPTDEVDIFGFIGTDVVAGEVKTKANDFTTAQLERDIRLSARLRADVHVMACLQSLKHATVEMAAAICGNVGLRLVVVQPDVEGILVTARIERSAT